MTFNQRKKYGIGIFYSPQRAIQAFKELRSTGFPMNKICAIANAPVRDEQLGYIDRQKRVSSLPFQGELSRNSTEYQAPSFEGPANPKSKIQNPKSIDTLGLTRTPAEGAAAGAVVGATKGGLLALIAGLGVLLVPGFGLALAAESLLTVLLGGGASAAVGGVVGALRGWFLPEEATIFYNHQISQGVYLVTVEGTENEIRRAKAILTRWGIQKWCVYNTSANEAER